MAGRSSASPTGRCARSFRLAPLISAIGMSILLQNFVQLAQGARVKPLPPLIHGGFTLFEDNGFAVRLVQLQIIIVVRPSC